MTNSDLQIPSFIQRRKFSGKLGDMLLEMQRQFPPFDFYSNKPEGVTTNDYLFAAKPVPFQMYYEYGQVKRWFLGLIRISEQNYRAGLMDEAIRIFETLVEHRYPGPKPYDLLIRHYKRTGDRENELRILDHSISFFTDLREKQREYVLSLSRQVGMEHKVLEYINNGKKICYYGGAFVLYDPVRSIPSWSSRKEMLRKIITCNE